VIGSALMVFVVSGAGCYDTRPKIRYQGSMLQTRSPKPPASMEIFRTAPPAGPHRDLGTVSVTCPSHVASDGFGGASVIGGCTYEGAVALAAKQASEVSADGLHSIETSVNSAGRVVSLRATTFFHLAKPAQPAAQPAAAPPAGDADVEARLRRLQKLRDDNLITPEEYAAKRAEILSDI
jgi:hypothetical protein